ncbi:Cleavage induced Predicted protein [Phytophthora palmivora]|uniref:Uncharacterized protein n=1 Tax=Phytophthora palmivora TaxID=4796 RepID=A0A2P4YG68_9STRA|nr:Cleavage induced Predicted protein [Phytophthora palmivora]
MVTILGPHACNEENFSPWFTEGKALGLRWNLNTLTLSMPPENIVKAQRRVADMLKAKFASKRQLNKLLGSLRHVTIWLRAAAPFLQRMCSLARITPRYRPSSISDEVREDLRWFAAILAMGRLNSVPMSHFTDSHTPDHQLQMDASDRGICVLRSARQEYLQVEFDEEERQQFLDFNSSASVEFSINIRELMNAFGLLDGRAQVAMSQHTSGSGSTTPRLYAGQIGDEAIHCVLEVQHNFYYTASHIPGVDNVMTDAGSSPDATALKKTLATLGTLLRAGALADTSRT